MKYSFVLPAYKGKYFKEAVESVLSQTYTDFELVIVDDCSPDNLLSLIRNRLDDERIHYYRNDSNIGGNSLISQWNYSISKANGEYIILASDDDRYDKDYLRYMDEIVCHNPKINVFRPRVSHIDSNNNIINSECNCNGLITREQYVKLFLEGKLFSGIPQYLFKKEAIDSIGGFVDFPLAWFSDDATVIALSANGVACSNKARFFFRKSDISLSNVNTSVAISLKKIQAAIQYYDFIWRLEWMSQETKNSIVERIRNQSYYIIKDNSLETLIKCLLLIEKERSGHLFPISWRIKGIASFIKRHII